MEANQDPSRIAAEWIEKWSHAKTIAVVNSAASGLDEEIPKEHPELCMAAILEVLKRIPCDPTDRHFQALAAGPLEDLLLYNGHVCVGLVEVAARQNPAFRRLLNGVWSSAIKPDVVARLSKYRTALW